MDGPVRIDLHSHSTASDGQFPPGEVAARARAAGLSTWGLCDHDTVAGLGVAAEAARGLGLRLVPGIELSAFLGSGHKEIHLLGHFLDPDHPALTAFEDLLADHRRTRVRAIVERLATLGVHVTEAAILAHSGGKTVGRPHVARAIVDAGGARDVRDAFDRWLGEGKPAYVGRYRLTVEDAVKLVRGAGGTVTIAHPGVSKIEVGEVGDDGGGGGLGDRGHPPGPQPLGP